MTHIHLRETGYQHFHLQKVITFDFSLQYPTLSSKHGNKNKQISQLIAEYLLDVSPWHDIKKLFLCITRSYIAVTIINTSKEVRTTELVAK